MCTQQTRHHLLPWDLWKLGPIITYLYNAQSSLAYDMQFAIFIVWNGSSSQIESQSRLFYLGILLYE